MRTVAADVAVIGAGILGAAVARALAEAGHRVALLDRAEPNREGSGTTAGNIHVQAVHGRPGQAVTMNPSTMLPLQVAAAHAWQRLEAELDDPIELTVQGGLTVAETDAEAELLLAKWHFEVAAGVPTEVIDATSARELEPLLTDRLSAATWCPLDGYANPLLVTPALIRAAGRAGTVVLAYTPVTGMARIGDEWHVTTSVGIRVVSRVVINVAGPWATQILAMLGVHLNVHCVTAQMHLTTRQPPSLRTLVQHVAAGLSAKQVASGQILVGGGWPGRPFDPVGRQAVKLSSVRGNLELAARIIPSLAQLELLRTWAGAVLTTPDELPIIGPVAHLPDYYLCGGTYSFTLAPLWAGVLTALVDGNTPGIDVSALRPDRFTGFGKAPAAVGPRRALGGDAGE